MQAPQRNWFDLIQITDLHYCSEPGVVLHSDVITDHSLHAVLDYLHRNEPHIDAIFATGDLAQDPVSSAYYRLKKTLQLAPAPVYALPGNHDDPDLAQRLLEGSLGELSNVSMPKLVTLGNWVIVMLDSTVYGQPYGHFHDNEKALLEETLARHPAEHALVCLHHHPLPVNAPWMDALMLDNPQDLFDTLAEFPQVRGVLYGHVHQDVHQVHQGIQYIGSPSTCIQWVPNTQHLEIDNTPPAYRRLRLHANGQLDTSVVYLDDYRLRASA